MLSVMCCTMCRLNETRPYAESPDNEPTAITASPAYQAAMLLTGQPYSTVAQRRDANCVQSGADHQRSHDHEVQAPAGQHAR